jgi:hypothetical protein
MPSDRDRPDEDLDAAFAAIIAGWDDVPSLDEPAESADSAHSPDSADSANSADDHHDDDVDASREAPPATSERPRRRAGDGADTASPANGPRDWSAAEDPDDDRYHPPEPPPLPRGDLAARLAWAGVLLGPAFLLVAGLFWRSAPRLWLALAVLAFVGGFVTLVLRLPADRDESDGDNGAVV